MNSDHTKMTISDKNEVKYTRLSKLLVKSARMDTNGMLLSCIEEDLVKKRQSKAIKCSQKCEENVLSDIL